MASFFVRGDLGIKKLIRIESVILLMTTIPIKIDDVELRKIDHLVKIGRFKNRSQAIRSFIRDKLIDETLLPDQVDPETEKRYSEILAKELVEGERERM
jgi:Arc/MetJ-type ribon-helix-helix transcriptional regulator